MWSVGILLWASMAYMPYIVPFQSGGGIWRLYLHTLFKTQVHCHKVQCDGTASQPALSDAHTIRHAYCQTHILSQVHCHKLQCDGTASRPALSDAHTVRCTSCQACTLCCLLGDLHPWGPMSGNSMSSYTEPQDAPSAALGQVGIALCIFPSRGVATVSLQSAHTSAYTSCGMPLARVKRLGSPGLNSCKSTQCAVLPCCAWGSVLIASTPVDKCTRFLSSKQTVVCCYTLDYVTEYLALRHRSWLWQMGMCFESHVTQAPGDAL